MTYDHLLLTTEESITTITLNRPDKPMPWRCRLSSSCTVPF